MNLVLLSDLHLMWDTPIARKDNIVKTALKKLQFVLDWADLNSATILQAGDFFDKPRSWLLLPKVIEMLKKKNVPIYSCFGQHDMYMYSEGTKNSTSLGILQEAGLVHILDENGVSLPTLDGEWVFLYGASWGKEVPQVKRRNMFNVLVTHKSIGVEPLFPGHQYSDALRFLKKNVDYDLILVGDIHRKFNIERHGRALVNTGPLLRSTAEEYSFEHEPGFFVYNTESNICTWMSIPHEPAEKILSREHIEKAKALNTRLDEFLNSFSGGFKAEVNLYDNIQKIVEETSTNQEVIDILSEIMEESHE